MKTVLRVAVVAFVIASAWGVPKEEAKTDEDVTQELIRESIAKYPGTCPCPYNIDRAGHKCGRRSAYSRPGGYSPLCFASDVTKEMVEEYRKRHKQ
jgi:hypothetical protein